MEGKANMGLIHEQGKKDPQMRSVQRQLMFYVLCNTEIFIIATLY